MFSLDVGWVVKRAPRQLRKSFALNICPMVQHSEAGLLRIGSIPNIVRRQESYEQRDRANRGVVDRFIRCRSVQKIQSGVAVRKRDSSKVPKDKHKAPFLVEDVPGCGNAFLSFHTRICI